MAPIGPVVIIRHSTVYLVFGTSYYPFVRSFRCPPPPSCTFVSTPDSPPRLAVCACSLCLISFLIKNNDTLNCRRRFVRDNTTPSPTYFWAKTRLRQLDSLSAIFCSFKIIILKKFFCHKYRDDTIDLLIYYSYFSIFFEINLKSIRFRVIYAFSSQLICRRCKMNVQQ